MLCSTVRHSAARYETKKYLKQASHDGETTRVSESQRESANRGWRRISEPPIKVEAQVARESSLHAKWLPSLGFDWYETIHQNL